MTVHPPAPSQPSHRKHVLLVDDEPAYTLLLKSGLERTGHYWVEPCNDPERALHMATQMLPDAILLDVLMPGRDGGDIFREIRNDPALRKIPTIMLTSLVCTHEVSWQGYVQSGEMLLMSKMSSISKIHECLSQMIDSSRYHCYAA
jgi:CheY-like chemotaxis protein